MKNKFWNSIADSMPLCTQTGDWDGKKSDEILVLTKDYIPFICTCYEGILDGSKYFIILDQDDCDITQFVLYWAEIPPLLFT